MKDLPHLGLYRRATVAALIVGPLLFLVDNLLHPEEFTRGHEARQLAEIGAHYQRWQAAHVIGLLSVFVFAAALLGLAFFVRRREPVIGLAGGALSVLGLVGLGAGLAIDGFTWGVLGTVSVQEGVDQVTIERTLQNVQESTWSLAYYGPIGLWVLGIVVLSVGLHRSARVPGWAAVLFGLGGVLVGLEPAIEHNWYFIVSALVLLSGCAAVAAALRGLDDEAFAAG